MLQDNATCKTLCTVEVPPEDAKFINDRIREDYAINWLVDGLPAAEMKEDKKTGELFFDMGFNLGYDEAEFKEMPALHNHYDIVLRSVTMQSEPSASAEVMLVCDLRVRRSASVSLGHEVVKPNGGMFPPAHHVVDCDIARGKCIRARCIPLARAATKAITLYTRCDVSCALMTLISRIY